MDKKFLDTTYEIALSAFGKNEHEKAFKYMRLAADYGSDKAMTFLGVHYKNGKILKPDYKVATDYFNKALQINKENGYAAFDLGRMYYLGLGVKVDYEKAFELEKQAISVAKEGENTYLPAAYAVAATCLIKLARLKEAVEYCTKARSLGVGGKISYYLGGLCEKGIMNVRKTEVTSTAMRLYEEAANEGVAEAMYALGNIYKSVNLMDEAELWYKKAADKGFKMSSEDMFILGKYEA